MRFIILLLSITFIASCTVQKRLHRPGWHIEWRHQMKKTKDASRQDEVDLNPAALAAKDSNQYIPMSNVGELDTYFDQNDVK
jgi:hypothetical protein